MRDHLEIGGPALMNFVAAASVLMLLLGIRETFRYRMLISRFAPATVIAGFLVSLAWLGTVAWALIAQGLLAGLVTLGVSLVVGQLARVGLQFLGDGGPLGPEQSARVTYEAGLIRGASRRSVESAAMREVIVRHNLTPEDLERFADLLERQGLTHDEISRAITRPEVVDWYFENVGRDRQVTLDKSLELIMLARG